MNFIKRGLISISRRKGKSLILLIAVLLVCNVIAGSIFVKKAIVKTTNSIKSSIPIELKIEVDYDKVINEMPSYISEDIIKKIGKSNYLKDFYYSYKYNLTSLSIKSVDDMILFREMENTKLAYDNYESYFNISGASSTKLKELENKTFKIISGNSFTSDDIKNGTKVVLISKELAKKNNLKVNDYINLNKKIEAYTETDTLVLGNIINDYKIIGIFESKTNKTTDNTGKVIDEYNPLSNYIYMPNNTIKVIHDEVVNLIDKSNTEVYDDFYISSSFYLNNMDNLENFKNDNLKLLPKGYMFTDNSNLYLNTLKPVNSMDNIANLIMYTSIIVSILVISLITLLFFRERKHEIGIYLALGEYKLNIALQVLFETIIVSLLAIFISVFTGNILSKNISNTLLETSIENKLDNDEYFYDEYGYILNYDKEDITDKYSVTLDINTILVILCISLGSITLSTLLPIYYTLKINPKKILM